MEERSTPNTINLYSRNQMKNYIVRQNGHITKYACETDSGEVYLDENIGKANKYSSLQAAQAIANSFPVCTVHGEDDLYKPHNTKPEPKKEAPVAPTPKPEKKRSARRKEEPAI